MSTAVHEKTERVEELFCNHRRSLGRYSVLLDHHERVAWLAIIRLPKGMVLWDGTGQPPRRFMKLEASSHARRSGYARVEGGGLTGIPKYSWHCGCEIRGDTLFESLVRGVRAF